MTNPVTSSLSRRRVLGALAVAAPALAAPALLSPPSAAADPTPTWDEAMTAVIDNADGERAGGLSSQLSTDPEMLRPLVERARAAGADPARYAVLLRQYWLAVAAQQAGIDLDHWDPAAGLEHNAATTEALGANFLRLARADERFYWAGMAGLAGMSFNAGFWDLRDIARLIEVPFVAELGAAVAAMLRQLPWQIARDLPRDVHLFATQTPLTTVADIQWYLRRLMAMQKHIFFDMVPMHEAYLAEGMPAIEELGAAGALDTKTLEAWRLVDAGTPEDLARALELMSSRELEDVITGQWDRTADRSPAIRTLTYVTTIGGAPDVPGAQAMGDYRPLSVTAEVDGEPYRLRTALPAFNWADRPDRWDYVRGDVIPAYVSLVQERPAEARAVLGADFRTRAAQNRIGARLPAFVEQISTGWALERL